MAAPNGTITCTQPLFTQVCSMIGQGIALTRVCENAGLPSLTTVYTYMRNNTEAQLEYARAKSDSGDADQNKIEDLIERVITGDLDPNAARVAIDALKWCASKKKPKVYGDLHKYQVEVEAIKVEHGITLNTSGLLSNIGITPAIEHAEVTPTEQDKPTIQGPSDVDLEI